ncbi:MAG: cation-translocating P-type ATPase, partial [Clostridiales bacterium]|nr:cation-translocating P-type ATPase [Clostridiales bacterium]
ALTGESVPVDKVSEIIAAEGDDVPLGDRKNMCYMGSNVVYGRGEAVITATGMDTEMGKIADALNSAKEEDTPLQIKLNQLSKVLTILVLAICVFIFALNIIRSLMNGEGIHFQPVLDTFMVAVSLAVAAIPEGLAAVVTIVLSIGVTKMSKRNAVIRKLTAVETLGCTQIICSDKTGTLTQNKMTVVENRGDDESLTATAMALCSDAIIEDGVVKGEPTEAALVAWADKIGLAKSDLEAKTPRVAEAPFDSNRKMMSTIHKTGNDFVQYTKGAPDVILSRCSKALVDGQLVDLSDDIRTKIMAANKEMADKALRVLCVAMKEHTDIPATADTNALENDMCYVGLAGMIDPVRPEVVDAIKEARGAGITPIMITGDHKDTAFAIAKELGIAKSDEEVITGSELDKISDEDFDEKIKVFKVYARVQPEHKLRIVNTWKKLGKVTAMTGDGVNDAPSIKGADIGVGMGITGTDVTKNVADMVLADDNFATIVSAVEEGRRIYDNIRKCIQFLLSSNLAEVITIFIATVVGFTILEPVHLLWINLITDCFPALALGMENGEGNLMKKAPRDSKEGVFANGMGIDVFWQGAVVTALTLLAYFIGTGWQFGNDHPLHKAGMTMAFLTLSTTEIFHSFNMRSRRSSILQMKNLNFFLLGAMALSLVLSCVAIYGLTKAFDFERLSIAQFGICMGLSFSIIPIVEIVKCIERAIDKKK